jgi:hypothetical protein
MLEKNPIQKNTYFGLTSAGGGNLLFQCHASQWVEVLRQGQKKVQQFSGVTILIH